MKRTDLKKSIQRFKDAKTADYVDHALDPLFQVAEAGKFPLKPRAEIDLDAFSMAMLDLTEEVFRELVFMSARQAERDFRSKNEFMLAHSSPQGLSFHWEAYRFLMDWQQTTAGSTLLTGFLSVVKDSLDQALKHAYPSIMRLPLLRLNGKIQTTVVDTLVSNIAVTTDIFIMGAVEGLPIAESAKNLISFLPHIIRLERNPDNSNQWLCVVA